MQRLIIAVIVALSAPLVAWIIYKWQEKGLTFATIYRIFPKGIRKNFEGKANLKKKEVGEHLNLLNENEYKIIEHLSIPVKDKIFTIDYLIVSTTGIYLINVYNYLGSIEEKENGDLIWSMGSRTFPSPDKEHKSLSQRLMALYNIQNPNAVHSVGVFSNQTELQVKSKTPVIHLKDLCKYIEEENRHYLSYEEVEMIYQEIKSQYAK